MKLNNPKYIIIWEKWYDPITKMQNQIQHKKRTDTLEATKDKENYVDDVTQDQIAQDQFLSTQFQPMMATPMGLIPSPMPDFTAFNFWIGHTNFSITNTIANLMNRTQGVETLDIFSPYRFRIAIGKAFLEDSVRGNIATIITTYLAQNDQAKKHFST